jgi:Ser/Thr protein kinase RdoA (MazF antagonist)
MPALSAQLLPLLSHLPEDRVGPVESIEPITMGLSGAGVYAVTAARGAFVLRVQGAGGDQAAFARQVRLLRRVADAGIAPAVIHVDETAHAVLSVRVPGRPLGAALGDPAQRPRALASVIDGVRALHALDPADVAPSDPVGFARAAWQAARTRPGFPGWAAALEPTLQTAAALLARAPRRVVSHNDVNPANVVWDGARAWLVDWEVAGLNHAHYDLAVFAMFLRLDDDSAFGLAERHDGAPLDQQARATFKVLRQFAAALCGLTVLGLVDDLSVRPSPARADAPSLGDCYAAMRTGQFDMRAPRDRASFGLALLAEALP